MAHPVKGPRFCLKCGEPVDREGWVCSKCLVKKTSVAISEELLREIKKHCQTPSSYVEETIIQRLKKYKKRKKKR